jgi:tight adherence protein B
MTTPTLPAFVGALAIVALAVWWVQPAPVRGRARPRPVAGGEHAPPWLVPGCPVWFSSAAQLADLPTPVERWWWAGLTVVVAMAGAGAVMGGPVLGLLAGAAAACGAVSCLRGARSRRDQRISRSVPDSLEAIARATRAGSSVVQALGALDAPAASAADRVFAGVAARVERGESLPAALDRVLEHHPVPAVRLAVAALLVGHETGAAPGRAVEGVAATLRDRAALEREARANASHARASVAVLVLAPIGFGVFAVATDPRVGEFLFRSWVGSTCLALGLALNGLGALWMRQIMASAR